MPSTKVDKFPIAIVAFGKISSTSLDKLQENTATLNHLATTLFLSPSLASGSKENVANYGTRLTSPQKYAELLADVLTVLGTLIGDVDKLYKELQNIDKKHSNAILEGKLSAITGNLQNLRDVKTSDSQKIFELVAAISHMDELLPLFSMERSVFREMYYYGAPLFAHFCAILKGIGLIAQALPGYNNSNILFLTRRYQTVLDWYRLRCIGRRMASCYVLPMLATPGLDWEHDWQRHFKKYEKYYEGSASFPWMSYGEKLGGVGWRVWSSPVSYCSIVDTWDTREYKDVKFEPLEVQQDSILARLGGALLSLNRYFGQQYICNILAEYRERVRDVMENFFGEVALLEEVREDLPGTEKIMVDQPCTGDVREDFPCAEEIKEDFPCTEEVKEDFPCAEEVKEDFPCTEEVKEDFPCAEEVKEDFHCAEEVPDSKTDRPTSLNLDGITTDSSTVPSSVPTPLQTLPTDFQSAMPTPTQDATLGLSSAPSTMPSSQASPADFQPAMKMPQPGSSPDMFPVTTATPLSSTGFYPGMRMPQPGFSPGLVSDPSVTTPSSSSGTNMPSPAIGFAPDIISAPSGPPPPSSKSPPYPML